MKIKDLIEIMGENQFPTYVFHWGTQEQIENGVGYEVKTDDYNTIEDLFSSEEICERDAIYIEYDTKAEEPIIHIYLKRQTFQTNSGRVREEKETKDVVDNSF